MRREDIATDSCDPAGFELASTFPEKAALRGHDGAYSGAPVIDPEFARLAAIWPSLPQVLRDAILRMAGVDQTK